ncbi:MAG TPA: flavodoxin family protein [Acidimicrobiales bacterium]|nr:flavodoxin family protein [Acidimicrobiales bacterium]
MNAVVIYESLTGNTRQAAEVIGEELRANGVDATVSPITNVDLAALSAADLVFVGSWVDGLFFVGQKPARLGRLKAMPTIAGKRAAVFCTYALDPGKTLEKMTAIVADRGGDVIGGMALHRRRIDAEARELVDRALATVGA